MMHLAVAVAHRGDQSRVTTQMFRVGKALNRTDFSDDHRRRIFANARQGHQELGARILVRPEANRLVHGSDALIQRIDQQAMVIQQVLMNERQLLSNLAQKLPSPLAKQVFARGLQVVER